jgi:hypothetical protein
MFESANWCVRGAEGNSLQNAASALPRRESRSESVSCGFSKPARESLFYEALCEWHFGEFASSQASTAEAISLAKELNDIHGLAGSLFFAGVIAQCARDHIEVERLASKIIELSTQRKFAHWLAGGIALRGWRVAFPVTRR